ncbi:Hypothetical protein NTJ_05142 [Nesidiocoris tenuis]|uniref:Uncharacterized protein n=1 Tax=Nesidiocoris tenuis TaxID=355587 RepID=A0ABN7AJC2_9HEMI|nr:Hypothetical protein NTJ_05142 [Nesidiocoris tenuis]
MLGHHKQQQTIIGRRYPDNGSYPQCLVTLRHRQSQRIEQDRQGCDCRNSRKGSSVQEGDWEADGVSAGNVCRLSRSPSNARVDSAGVGGLTMNVWDSDPSRVTNSWTMPHLGLGSYSADLIPYRFLHLSLL